GPGPVREFDRRHDRDRLRRDSLNSVMLVILGEAQRNLVDVAGRDQGSIRVCRIDDHLHGRGLSLAKVLRETGIDSQRYCDVTSIDEISNLAVIRELML